MFLSSPLHIIELGLLIKSVELQQVTPSLQSDTADLNSHFEQRESMFLALFSDDFSNADYK